jgi:peptide/nickel transport system permease protein
MQQLRLARRGSKPPVDAGLRGAGALRNGEEGRGSPRIPPLAAFILRRVGLGIGTVWVVTVLIFAATEALPGSAAVAKLGRNATPAATAAFNAEYKLNAPLVTQYLRWLSHIVQGHWGVSLITGQSVSGIVDQRIGYTLVLMLFAAAVGVPIATTLGVLAALRRDRTTDHLLSVAVLALAAAPEFVIGIVLVTVLATNVFQILPAASIVNPEESIWKQLNLVVLPGVTLALAILPYVTRIVRGTLTEVLESNYVAMARLKGLSEPRVIWRHAMSNAAGPIVQVIALCLVYLAGGAVVTETVFQYPGLGLGLVTAVGNRDLPVIQVITMLLAVFYIGVTIGADVITVLMSPRTRTEIR